MHERPADVLDDRGLDALGRLVEDEKLGLHHQRAGDGELLLLAAGKVAAAAPEHVAEHREERKNLVVDHALGALQRGEAGHQVLAHGEQRKNLAPLRHVAETRLGAQVAGKPGHVVVVPADRAGGDHVLADDGAQKRRLADAVPTEHR